MALTFRFGGPSESAYREGLKLLSAQHYPQAILKFNEALELDPKHPKAARRLAEAYEALRKEKAEPRR
jgi:tetratricopeptide (TPR) repeat protein